MKKIKIASFFSGIGGFETGIFQALGRGNVEVVFASEIDKYASTAYAHLYGHVPHGDITQIPASDVPDHDLLVGGFPCQAFSVSGKRLGFEDARGTLFFEIARIAKEKRPKMMVLENVKGLVGHDNGRTLAVIAKTLSELDYKIDIQVLNSKFHHVAQNRQRIFIICHRDIAESPWEIGKSGGVVNVAKRRLLERGDIKMFNFSFPEEEQVTVCLRDILEPYVPEKYYMSEEKLKEFVSNGEKQAIHKKVVRDLKQIGYIDKNAQGNRVYSVEGVSPTVSSQTGGLGGSGGGVFAIFDARLKEALEEDVRSIVSKSRPNADISVNFKENGDIRPHRNDPRKSGLSELNINFDGNQSFTVTASHAPKIYGSSTGWRIRKLTPLECFRLQGFPDSYVTQLQEIGISDRQLYKMAGNAVTTNVIEAIFREVKSYI